MSGIGFLLTIISLCLIPFLLIGCLLNLLSKRWRATDRNRHGTRAAIVLAGMAIVASPYLLYKAWELHAILARVPSPLHASWIEYRLEEASGSIGLPGDNETGFVVYRLTDASTQWALTQGVRLDEALPGGAADWHAMPVKANEPASGWHTKLDDAGRPVHEATIAEYLNRYGFSIPIEEGRDAEANRAIHTTGSFYSYGWGGSVTIVDPARGKVYFAYAG